jgi:hypothetical protein
MLNHVSGVSWPSSGHHLLCRLLERYFVHRWQYCDFYEQPGCCGQFPCARQGQITFTKNHDNDLDLPEPTGRVLVQYRDFMPSVVSNFELYIKDGNDDTRESFENFARYHVPRWATFVRKWVVSSPGRLIIKYEDLVSDPVEAAARAVLFFGDSEVNHERLAEIAATAPSVQVRDRQKWKVPGAGVKMYRQVKDFRYYDEDLFAELGAQANELWLNPAPASPPEDPTPKSFRRFLGWFATWKRG